MEYLIDSHAHLDDPRFDEDRDQLITQLNELGVDLVINPGADRTSSEKAISLSEIYENIYAAVGTHPHDADGFTEEDFAYYKQAASLPKVVAIGEIGLDYYYDNSPRELQKTVFRRQLELAEEVQLPVLIHSREADQDTFALLEEFQGRVKGVMHCYSGSVEMAKRYLGLGYYISLAGPVTFKNARVPKEVAAMVPADRLLVETDSPYLSPEPKRGKRNDPSKVVYVAREIAKLRGMSYEELAKLTRENTLRLFEKLR
ncbi:MAG: TatD family hydrolase [Tissierellia bacterium]|nr:TatD family hydrolase [Tissierellia bacterium]